METLTPRAFTFYRRWKHQSLLRQWNNGWPIILEERGAGWPTFRLSPLHKLGSLLTCTTNGCHFQFCANQWAFTCWVKSAQRELACCCSWFNDPKSMLMLMNRSLILSWFKSYYKLISWSLRKGLKSSQHLRRLHISSIPTFCPWENVSFH